MSNFLNYPDKDKPILFLHIPRTGGTSFRWMMAAQYGNEKMGLIRYDYLIEAEVISRQEDFKVITGHLYIDDEVVQNLNGTYNSITILRHPLYRALSFYHYATNWKGNNEHEAIKSYSLEEFLIHPQFSNMLCNHIGGNNSNSVYVDACSNLSRLTLFGFYERYAEMIAIAQRRFDWGGVVIRREEHIDGVSTPEQLSKGLLDKWAELNKMDIDFYGYAVTLYEERRLKWLE